MARLTFDGCGGFVWTDFQPGDIIPDGVGGYYIYSEEKKRLEPYNRETLQISDKTTPITNIYLQQKLNTSSQIDCNSTIKSNYITSEDKTLQVDESRNLIINIPKNMKDNIENIIIKWS